MFVSNGNGYAVPVSTRKTSTSVTSPRRFSDERRTGTKVEDTSTLYDAGDDANELALRRVVYEPV